MSPRLLAPLFVVLSSSLWLVPVHAQQANTSLPAPADCVVYTTPSESDAWLATVTGWALPQQIEALRHRMACDAGLRSYPSGVCYMAGPQVVSATQPVDPRPAGLGIFCLLDGYPLFSPISPAFQHLITARSVKKLTLLASSEAAVLGGSNASGGTAVITTRTPRATRRQWQLAVRQASASKANQ